MEVVQSALRPLASALPWFVGAADVRALHVVTTSALRDAALAQITAAAHDPGVHAVWLACEADDSNPAAAWQRRAEEIRESWDAVGEALAEESVALAGPSASPWSPLSPLPEDVEPLVAVRLLLHAALEKLPLPFERVIVVLAPITPPIDRDAWTRDCTALFRDPMLEKVRWIVVEPGSVSTSSWAESDAERVDVCTTAEEGGALLASLRAPVLEASESSNDVARGAGPTVMPPPRPTDTVAPQDGRLSFVAHTLAAAEAAQAGDVTRAATEQRLAADACAASAGEAETLTLELMEAAYLLQTADATAARERFLDIATRARQADQPIACVQAELFAATTFAVECRWREGAEAYERAAQMAKAFDQTLLAIESLRMAGECYVLAGDAGAAGNAWRAAVELSESEHEVLSGPSASTAARRLAEYCRTHGLTAQADALLERASALEAKPVTAGPR